LFEKQNTFILFLSIDKRACNYFKCDPTFVDEWHSEISTSYQQKKKVGGRLDNLQTDGLDGLRALAGSQVRRARNDVNVNTSTLAWMYTRHVGVKEKHKMGKFTSHFSTANAPFKNSN
jgi:hypothetical protein